MGQTRITINTLRSGQPRAYADSVTQVRVTFEQTDPMLLKSDAFIPMILPESAVVPWLKNLRCGFIEERNPKHGLEPHLVYLVPIDPVKIGDPGVRAWGKPNEFVSHIWEFQVVSPFTD